MGKNYSEDLSADISGKDLLELAMNAIRELQHRAGGNIVFLEAEDHEKLLAFYEQKESGFVRFDVRSTGKKNEGQHELVQLLKLI